MSETKLSKAIRVAIARHFPGIRFTRLQAGIITAKHGAKIHCADNGWCDIVGYLPDGRFFGVEVKMPGSVTQKERKELQDARLADINACGGIAIKVEGVLDCITQLKERGL